MKRNQKIRSALEKAGLTQWAFAERCGVSEATVYRWLRSDLPKEKELELLTKIKEVSSK